jgi:hypothetical protein
MNQTFLIPILLIFNVLSIEAQPRKSTLPASLQEISGLARTPDGALWALCDGDNPAALYRLNPSDGRILDTRSLPLPNRDWEDLAAAPDGCLWIADAGNNLNRRRDLRAYRYCPADGRIDSVLFRYPDQTDFPPAREADWQYDCEALVVWRDTLHFFTKSRFRSDHTVRHYVVPARPSAQVYEAELRHQIRLPGRVVSGAALSPDGRTLALTTYIFEKKWGFWPHTRATLVVFRDFEGTDFLKGKMTRRRLPRGLFARQFESVVAWQPGIWLAANEGLAWQKPRLWRLRF